MRGTVSESLTPEIGVRVVGPVASAEYIAAIDTGFNGGLTLPAAEAARLGLESAGFAAAQLGDGSVVRLAKHVGEIEWLGARRAVTVMACESAPLVGMDLLHGSALRMHIVVGGEVSVERAD